MGMTSGQPSKRSTLLSFTLAGCAWEYEPPWEQGLSPDGWLPDFRLWPDELEKVADTVLVEVKPPLQPKTLARLMKKIDRAISPAPKGFYGPVIWVTSGGLAHLGKDADGFPEITGIGPCRYPGGDWRLQGGDLGLVLGLALPQEAVAPFGERQLQFGYDSADSELFTYDYNDFPDAHLPVGYRSWGAVWREACALVKREAVSIPPPPNPREWIALRESEVCPDCGEGKTPGFLRCRECAREID